MDVHNTNPAAVIPSDAYFGASRAVKARICATSRSPRARSSRPSARAGVLAAQRAASVGAGLKCERPRQRPVGPLTGSGAEVKSGSDGPTPATSRAPIAGKAHLRPASSQWARLGARHSAPAGAALAPAHGRRAGGAERAAGRQPRPGVLGWIAGGAVLTVRRGVQPVRPQSCGRARTRLRLRGRAGTLSSDAQIGRERARSAKGRRGQAHGNYALNAHLAHRCPQTPAERVMKSPAGAGLSKLVLLGCAGAGPKIIC